LSPNLPLGRTNSFQFWGYVFSSLEAAAAFWVARLVALLWLPGLGLQLPLVPGLLPGVGSKPGQQGLLFFAGDFFAVVMLA
jgi:hypothetical protein